MKVKRQDDKIVEMKECKAKKVALGILGVGVIVGISMAYVLDVITKTVFINEEWEEDQLSSDDWLDD